MRRSTASGTRSGRNAAEGRYEARLTAAANPMSSHPVSMSAPASGSGRTGLTVPSAVAAGGTATAAAAEGGAPRSSVNAVPSETANATTATASRIIRRRRRINNMFPWARTGAASGRPGAGPVPETRTSYRPVRTRLTPRWCAISSDVPRMDCGRIDRTLNEFAATGRAAGVNWNSFVLFGNFNSRIQQRETALMWSRPWL